MWFISSIYLFVFKHILQVLRRITHPKQTHEWPVQMVAYFWPATALGSLPCCDPAELRLLKPPAAGLLRQGSLERAIFSELTDMAQKPMAGGMHWLQQPQQGRQDLNLLASPQHTFRWNVTVEELNLILEALRSLTTRWSNKCMLCDAPPQ